LRGTPEMRGSHKAIERLLVDPAFLQKLSRWAILAGLVLGAVVVLQSIVIITLVTHAPRIKYIYHDGFNKPRELLVTDQPYFTNSQVMNWTVEKVTTLYTLDFVHIEKQLDAASTAFAPPAWNAWGQSFQGSGNIQYIKNRRVFVTATPRGAASVRSVGVKNGVYFWKIDFPMDLRFENESGSRNNLLSVHVTISKTNDPLHPDGLEITELSAPLADRDG